MLSPEGLTMALYKSRSSKVGPYHENSRIFNLSSALPTSIIVSFMDVPKPPLTCLTCKGIHWNFSNECHSAFQALKKAFTTAPVLAHWIPDTQITVETAVKNGFSELTKVQI